MRFVLLLGIKPVAWAKAQAEERARMRRAIDDWFGELKESGALLEELRFATWKQARTVSLDSGIATDVAGPLLVGRPKDAESLLVACVLLEAKTLKAAVRVASSWPVREAVVEVRPIDGAQAGSK